MCLSTHIIQKSFLLLLISIFFSCKKKEGQVGSQGPMGPPATQYDLTVDGYIKGNITGIRQDGVPFNETFNLNSYYTGPAGSGTMDSIASNYYTYSFNRVSNSTLFNNYMSILISGFSKNGGNGNVSLYMNYENYVENNKIFRFYTSTFMGSACTYTYNESSGIISGVFNINISPFDNSTGNNATLNGSFDVHISQIVNKSINTTKIKTD